MAAIWTPQLMYTNVDLDRFWCENWPQGNNRLL
jgi:hypothetical protein